MRTSCQSNNAIASGVGCRFTRMFVCLFGLGILGCSSNQDEIIQSQVNQLTSTLASEIKSESELSESDSAEGGAAKGQPIAKTEMPSPGRTNAFEMSGEFRAEVSNQESGGKREIYIMGFVEVEVPSVMLAIDGRTHVLAAGDTFDRITVQEILPPNARLICDGVSWNASILDRRNSTNESQARKKGTEPSR